MRFRWVQFHIEISKATESEFTGLVLPNAGEIQVDQVLDRFRISSSVPEIFAAKLWSRLKLGQILHVLAPKIFLGKAPKILDRQLKIRPSTDHRAKFCADRPMHLGDLAFK